MNIYEAVTNIMQEGYAITKSKRNTQQGFMYRGIDDVMNTFQPLLSKYKVFCVPEVLEQTREERETNKGGKLIYSILRTRYTFFSEDGTSIAAVVVGEGMDSGDKASNKALAIGMKYAMFQVFCIPTEEMKDPDAETHEPSRKIEITCDACGKVLAPYEGKDGKTVSIAKHVARSTEKFGKVLCIDCINKENGNAAEV